MMHNQSPNGTHSHCSYEKKCSIDTLLVYRWDIIGTLLGQYWDNCGTVHGKALVAQYCYLLVQAVLFYLILSNKTNCYGINSLLLSTQLLFWHALCNN